MNYNISRWDSPHKDQRKLSLTAKFCQTYAFCNMVENQINKYNCYRDNINALASDTYLSRNSVELDEVEVQREVQKFYGLNFSSEPVRMEKMLAYYQDNEILDSIYKVDKVLKMKINENLGDYIRRCLNNRLPVFAAVRGTYRYEKIGGIWTTIYNLFKTWGGGHAVMIDGWDGTNFLCQNSTNPRAYIKPGHIFNAIAFNIKKI